MVKYIDGDLFTAPGLDAICHQANCFKRMRSGIARCIGELRPEAVVADLEHPGEPCERLGSFTVAICHGANFAPQLVFNLYGQFNYGTDSLKTDYAALKSAMLKMKKEMEIRFRCQCVVGIPHGIGCGLAGGDWVIVDRIINDVFSDGVVDAVVVKKA
jgi:O-acetyl-ADP-ribose deacetylase (regulator of RNase III)